MPFLIANSGKIVIPRPPITICVGEGHLGDLPALYVDTNGNANLPTLAPRLHVNDLQKLTLMVHANGDNYSDNPPVGGGGSRIACGLLLIKKK